MTLTPKTDTRTFRALSEKEIRILDAADCRASDWRAIRVVSEGFNPNLIRNVNFIGAMKIGANVSLEDIQHLEFTDTPRCGIGTQVAVLDETGSRSVTIYPGISSQIATIMARIPEWTNGTGKEIINEAINSCEPFIGIDDNSTICNCTSIIDVSVGKNIRITGALSLRNGSVINNAPSGKEIARIGCGVIAENFIVEDGILDSRATVKNCYIGQGASVGSNFSAHDSLFFTNCCFENGESCALLANPFSVSMHKSSLMIGCQTSFFNAGSGTNQSNHMYKIGPVHWGVLERGVKTSSDSYIMLGARIGAFSLVMGQHKTHPDSSTFPFSYLFGDERGATVVVPGAMLRSCGLLRDERKWMDRDCRNAHHLPKHDRIVFGILNPFTVNGILEALTAIDQLVKQDTFDDRFLRYRGMKLTRASLERARTLYSQAVYKYLSTLSRRIPLLPHNPALKAQEWVDLGGMLLTRDDLNKALEAQSLKALEKRLAIAFDNYEENQMSWVAARLGKEWSRQRDVIACHAAEFDRIMEEDLTRTQQDLKDMEQTLRL